VRKVILPAEPLLLPREVADLFGVKLAAVRQARLKGRITSVRTPGGANRYRASEVCALLNGMTEEQAQ